jgi:hypothetical protein
LKLALPEMRGPRALRFSLHIVAIMLQVILKTQAISERENRTPFLQSSSLRRRAYLLGRFSEGWCHRSEIAVLSVVV